MYVRARVRASYSVKLVKAEARRIPSVKPRFTFEYAKRRRFLPGSSRARARDRFSADLSRSYVSSQLASRTAGRSPLVGQSNSTGRAALVHAGARSDPPGNIGDRRRIPEIPNFWSASSRTHSVALGRHSSIYYRTRIDSSRSVRGRSAYHFQNSFGDACGIIFDSKIHLLRRSR